ncbi:MAG: hypothetical protein IJA73_01665 [Oscillospiraceae bacterium]|nr:hypothetical protein [Oscillospiraceae bacterium]
MRKTALYALMMSLALTLCACAGEEMSSGDFAAAVQETYRNAASMTMETKLRCDAGDAVREYMLDCTYEHGGGYRVTVTGPQELAGISASVDGGSLALHYDGVTLEAGDASKEVCAANAAAYVMEAAARGYVLEQSKSEWNGEPCRRVAFETSFDGKAEMLCTVCFTEDMTPLYAEISENGVGFVFMEFTSFAFGDIIE